MKITAVETFLVSRYLLVRVHTDEGLVGNGEAGLWAHHGVVEQALRELSDYYVGKDPFRIEHHFQAVSRATHFTGAVLSAALSAVDIALWDILGKASGQPVYQLLGGACRDRVRVFANVVGRTVAGRAASARKEVAAGFTALRMTPFHAGFEQQDTAAVIDDAVAMVAAVRDAIGPRIDLGLEIHRNLTTDAAISLANELGSYRIMFYEDPLPPESVEAHAYIARHIDIPMALGERGYGIATFKDLVDRQMAAFIRTDLSLAGGFTQCRKIAAIAEAAGVQIFPHLMGSPVNSAAFTHFAASIPNYALMEAHPHTPEVLALVDHPFKVVDGYRELPDRPGIGLDINEDALASLPFEPRPIAASYHSDNSVAH